MHSSEVKTAPIIHLENIESIREHLDIKYTIQYFWLGKHPYRPIWDLQKKLHSQRVKKLIPDVVLLLEHDHVYTLGKNADSNLLLDTKPENADIINIDRGGQVTYHGDGH